jgi:hypothetical protein
VTGQRPLYFPSEQQELLLKAALLSGPAAIGNWNAWREMVSVEDLDAGSQRLLPMLYQKLRVEQIEHPDMARYRSVYRHTWVENQHRIYRASGILNLLAEAGISVILLKGIALSALYYGDVGQRPMSDLDFLVKPEAVQEAARLLQAAGWDAKELPLLGIASFRSVNHAVMLTRPQSLDQIDLHWHVLHERCWESADEEFWLRSRKMLIGSRTVSTLSDTDHLLHTCLHGSRQNQVAPIRWVADAMMIVCHGEVDWPYLVASANAGGYARRVTSILRYLVDTFDAPVPAEIFSDFEKVGHKRIERFEEMLARHRLPEFFATLGHVCAFFWRNPGYRKTPLGFFKFLKARWGSTSLAAALRESSLRSAKHIFRQR